MIEVTEKHRCTLDWETMSRRVLRCQTDKSHRFTMRGVTDATHTLLQFLDMALLVGTAAGDARVLDQRGKP